MLLMSRLSAAVAFVFGAATVGQASPLQDLGGFISSCAQPLVADAPYRTDASISGQSGVSISVDGNGVCSAFIRFSDLRQGDGERRLYGASWLSHPAEVIQTWDHWISDVARTHKFAEANECVLSLNLSAVSEAPLNAAYAVTDGNGATRGLLAAAVTIEQQSYLRPSAGRTITFAAWAFRGKAACLEG